MISHAFTVFVIASAAFLAACGGGGSSSTPAASGAPSVEPALDAVKAFLTKYDALLATAIPTPGAANTSLSDGCSLGDGRTKAYVIADFDADAQAVASRQWIVGSTRTNVAVAADRTSANADGTSRREIDVTYAINYKDGTKQENATQTIISGSSSGAKLPDGTACTTPDSKTDWRFYGNRKIVATFVSASNQRLERTSLATGLDKSPRVVYSKFITLGVQDPAKVATYATISGPGLGFATVGSPGTLKLLSVRLLRDAPELAGQPGNYVDELDTDSFRVCSNAAATNFAPADTADCVANGARGNSWGVYNRTSGSDLDTVFAKDNITKGAVYTINVYGDDGWKSVNGQAGKTPIATYTSTLDNLPLNAEAMAGTGVTADLFARVTMSTKTQAEIATAIRTKAAISTGLTWTMPGAMPDSRATALSFAGTAEAGQANATGAAWPASTGFDLSFPGPLAASSTVNFPAPAATLVVPTYAEFSLGYVNRNGNSIRSIYTFEQSSITAR